MLEGSAADATRQLLRARWGGLEHPAAPTPAEPCQPWSQPARKSKKHTDLRTHTKFPASRERENSVLIADFNNINTLSRKLTLQQRMALSEGWGTQAVPLPQARSPQPFPCHGAGRGKQCPHKRETAVFAQCSRGAAEGERHPLHPKTQPRHQGCNGCESTHRIPQPGLLRVPAQVFIGCGTKSPVPRPAEQAQEVSVLG